MILRPPVRVKTPYAGVAEAETRFELVLRDGSRIRGACPAPLPKILGGETVRARGLLYPRRGRRNPGQRSSRNPPRFLRVPHAAGIEILAEPPFSRLRSAVGRTRGRLCNLLVELFPPPVAALLAALCLGDRRLLSLAQQQAFIDSGTLPLLAISGLHVAVLMFWVLRVPLPHGLRTPLRLFFLVSFCALTGSQPPVVRAALMLGAHLLLQLSGRCPTPLNTLGWCAVLLITYDPTLLRDVGFQLSFTGVFSLLALGRPPKACLPEPSEETASSAGQTPPDHGGQLRRLAGLSARNRSQLVARASFAFGRALRASVAAWAGTAPLVATYFFRLHPLAPLWVVLAGPLLAPVLVGGLVTLALGLVHPHLAAPLALPVSLAAEALGALLGWAAKVPGSTFACPPPTGWAIAGYYSILMAFAAPAARRPALICGVALLAFGTLTAPYARRAPEVWIFADGSRDCTLIAVPEGGTFLIDAGASGGPTAGDRLANRLLALGQVRIDGAFLTHPHDDHVGAMPRLSRRLPVGFLGHSPYFGGTPLGAEVLATTRRQKTLQPLSRGARLRVASEPVLTFDVLFPQTDEPLSLRGQPNDVSLAIRVTCGEASLLFLGDLEEAGLARLLGSETNLRADVLLFPHHGRKHALWQELLERVGPHHVILSGSGRGGADDMYRQLRRSGVSTFATWQGGAVRLVLGTGGRWRPTYGTAGH